MRYPKPAGRIMLLLACLFIGAGYYFHPDFFHDIIELLRFADVAHSVQLIQSYGQNAKLAVFLIIVLINTLAFLPNIFVLAASGVLFGIVEGTLIAWTAETVGVSISFLLMRYLFRSPAKRFIEKHGALHRLDDFSGKNGFRIIAIARSVPYLPSGLITALAALSQVSFKDHLLATLLGKLPSAWAEVTIGHDIFSFRAHILRLLLLTAASILVYVLFLRRKREEGL